MNILKRIFLLDYTIARLGAKGLLALQSTFVLLFSSIVLYFSFNSDWKRWLCLLAFLALIKTMFDVSISITNLRNKSDYKLAELVSWTHYKKNPKPGNFFSAVMLLLIIGVSSLFYRTYQFLEEELHRNGMRTKAIKQDLYWRSTPKKENAGFYMEYCYYVKGTKYEHRMLIGKKSNIKNLKVIYLPYLPNKHRIEFKRIK